MRSPPPPSPHALLIYISLHYTPLIPLAPPLSAVSSTQVASVVAKAAKSMLCAQARASVDVTERGVTLRFLLQLVEGGAVDGSWTIQQVVDRYVRPMTATSKCCLYDVVPEPSCPGHPQYFVSHTWSRKMNDLLKLLKDHFHVDAPSDAAAGVVLWLDIVAINQHPYEAKGCLLNDDVANLAKVVGATERTLFILDAECVSLSRIWCLYEVWQTFLAKGAAGLLVLMPSVGAAKLRGVFETFDVMQAEATQAEDRDRILGQISDSPGGATQVNLQLKCALVDSAMHEAAHSTAEGADLAMVLDKAGGMLRVNGQYSEAEPLYRQALEGRTRVLGPDHQDTLSNINNLAICIDDQGRRAEAEPLYRQALEGMARLLGPDHPDALAGINNLAACISGQGRDSEAEPLYRQALEGRTRVLGPDHPDTLSGINNLAMCIHTQSHRSEAEPLFRQALDGRTRVLGPDHPETLSSINNLATCIKAQGRLSEAEPLYRQALEGRTRVLGLDHPSTLASVYNLAGCIADRGRRSDAEPLYCQAVEGRTRVLGPGHPDTLSGVDNLANCIASQGRYSEAEPLFRYSMEGKTHVFGPDHPDTLSSVYNLASCIEDQGRRSEAEPLYRQALEGRTRVLGPDHPSTADAGYNLANNLKQLGRVAEAAELFRQAHRVYLLVYGPEHPEALDAARRAQACCDGAGGAGG